MKKRYLHYIFIASLLLLTTSSSFAAKLNVRGNTASVQVGDSFTVEISLNAMDIPINTLSGTLSFSKEILDLTEVREGNSIINLWISKPEGTNLGTSSFSGIIPGGYQGSNGTIFTLIFKAKQQGKASVSLENMNAYKNDGSGSSVSLETSPWNVRVTNMEKSSSSEISFTKEYDNPEIFKPLIARDISLFDGSYFISFVTQDKGSGIDHYEVKEGFFGRYVTTTSPYALKNQDADSVIYVKAIDNDGNEQTAYLYGPNYKPWYTTYYLLGALALLSALFWFFLPQNFSKKKS